MHDWVVRARLGVLYFFGRYSQGRWVGWRWHGKHTRNDRPSPLLLSPLGEGLHEHTRYYPYGGYGARLVRNFLGH